MQLKPFLLDMWLDTYDHEIEFNLAASTGPCWTLNEILSLAGDEERQRFLHHNLVYSRPAGAEGLRAAIADMQGVNVDSVQVVTGASEALLILMWLAAEPGANVVLPRPGYAPFSALPESLGIETRFYALRRENEFRIDVDEVKKLADENTKMIVVNSPHHPTGATISDAELDSLHDFAWSRGIQLVNDEVYHPIYHPIYQDGATESGSDAAWLTRQEGDAGDPFGVRLRAGSSLRLKNGCAQDDTVQKEAKLYHCPRSAARLPHATVIHDFSKAFPLSGVRTGWMIEHDPKRRELYWNARAYFSISNNTAGEMLAEIAMRHRNTVLGKTQETATRNLRRLEGFMAEHRDKLGWVPPRGGMTAFPWLLSGENSRAFCRAAAEQGILLAPGDCFDAPSHFRLGFAAMTDKFPDAMDRLGEFVSSWSAAEMART
ncbi:MAG: aminotransferase class I/II-fold pyridoxal phosphate-dependent enzyme [Candidatus Sulfotelmatobacter sp.]